MRADHAEPAETLYVKVLRPRGFSDVVRRHTLLREGGVPAPEVLLATDDQLLVTRELPGVPLAHALFDGDEPCRPEDIVELLDAMPPAVSRLERRPPWADAVGHYARMVTATLPELTTSCRGSSSRLRPASHRIPWATNPPTVTCMRAS